MNYIIAALLYAQIGAAFPIDKFECKSNEPVEFTTDGKNWRTTAKPFSFAILPGGGIRVRKPALNFQLEVALTDSINWEQKRISKSQAFPFEVKVESDKRSYFDFNLVRLSQKKESVLNLNCRRTN